MAGKGPLRFVVAHEHRLRPGRQRRVRQSSDEDLQPRHEVRRFAHLGGGRCTEQEMQSPPGARSALLRAISGHNREDGLSEPYSSTFHSSCAWVRKNAEG